MFTLLGSFPNSQIRPRTVTESQNTYVSLIPASPAEATIVPANPDRSFATIENTGAFPIKIGYPADFGNLATQGFTVPVGGSYDIETAQEVRATGIGGASQVDVDEGSG